MTAAADIEVRNRLIAEWKWTKTQLERVNSVVLRPSNAYDVVHLSKRANDRIIAVNLGPLVLNVPERGNRQAAHLYIYVSGSFEFSRALWLRDGTLDTTHVQTEAAYFRGEHRKDLLLVHGAHYDYTPGQRGHPVFHMQLRGALLDYASVVRACFGLTGEVSDGIPRMLRNVRAASAQIDVFSFLVQIAADHLLPQSANVDQRDAFNSLRARADLCGPYCREGEAGSSQPLPASDPTRGYRCFRARHWYAQI